jgi:hypothetical protein
MAKAPTPGRGRSETSIRIGYDGREWAFSASEIAPRDVADLRRETGLAALQALKMFRTGDGDLDTAGAVIFLARRQSESRSITFDDATVGLGYDSEVTVHVDGQVDDEDDSHPEA